jgi:signal transduction histidine kinase
VPAAPPSSNSDKALLAVAAHELRHPLHLMRLALARLYPRGDEDARQVMERYIDRMSRIVSDMTDLVRIDQNQLALELASIDLTEMLREIVDAYAPDAQLRRLSLTLEGAATPAVVTADPQRLAQVLSNILDNALKFTPADGAVMVTVTRQAAAFEVRVRDTGTGISEEMLPRVFDLYAGSALRGMGIGLTVAHRIVRMHNGDIAIFSEGDHKGTEVVITLPVEQRSYERV